MLALVAALVIVRDASSGPRPHAPLARPAVGLLLAAAYYAHFAGLVVASSCRGCSRAGGRAAASPAPPGTPRGSRSSPLLGQWGVPAIVLAWFGRPRPAPDNRFERDLAACWLAGASRSWCRRSSRPLEVRYVYALTAAVALPPARGRPAWRRREGRAASPRACSSWPRSPSARVRSPRRWSCAIGSDRRLDIVSPAVAFCGRRPSRAGGTFRQPWPTPPASLGARDDGKGRLISIFVGAVLLPSLALSYVSIEFVPELAKAKQGDKFKQAERTLYYIEKDLASAAQAKALEAAQAVGCGAAARRPGGSDRRPRSRGRARLGTCSTRCSWKASSPAAGGRRRRAARPGPETPREVLPRWSRRPSARASEDAVPWVDPDGQGLGRAALPLLSRLRPAPAHPASTSSTTSRTPTRRSSSA